MKPNIREELKTLKVQIHFKENSIPSIHAGQMTDESIDALIKVVEGAVPEKKDAERFEGIGEDGGIDISTYDEAEDPSGTKNGDMLAHLAQFASDTGWNEAIDAFNKALTKEEINQ